MAYHDMNGKTTFIYWLAGLLIVSVGALWGLNVNATATKQAELDKRVESLEKVSVKSSLNIALICQALEVKGCQP